MRITEVERKQLRIANAKFLTTLTKAHSQTFLRIAIAAFREQGSQLDIEGLAQRVEAELAAHPHLSKSHRFRPQVHLGDQTFGNPELESLAGPALELLESKLPSSWRFYKTPPLDSFIRPDLGMLNPNDRLLLWIIKPWQVEDIPNLVEEAEDNFRYWASSDSGEPASIRTGSDFLDTIHRILMLWESSKDHFGIRVNSFLPAFKSVLQCGLILPNLETGAELAPLRSVWDRAIRSRPSLPWYGGIHELSSGVHPLFTKTQLASAAAFLKALPARHRTEPPLFDDALGQRFQSLLTVPNLVALRSQPLEMDQQQMQLANERTASGYRRVIGPAGSGKSLVLAARAAHLVAEGKRVLVLTFNITLHRYLRDLYLRHAAQLQINPDSASRRAYFFHFHGYLKELVRPFPELSDKWLSLSFGDSELPNLKGPNTTGMIDLALEALSRHQKPFDAVLVDEGQDWDPKWWEVVRQSHTPGGECLLVSDATQDLYGRNRLWTTESRITAGFNGSPKGLVGSYRLHPKVIDLLAAFAADFLLVDADPPRRPQQLRTSMSADPTLRLIVTDAERIAALAADEIASAHRFIESIDTLSIPDVFFAVDQHDLGEHISVLLETSHQLPVQDVFRTTTPENNWIIDRRKKLNFASLDHAIKGTTIHSMKGWESRAVVTVFGAESSSSNRELRNLELYVAISRLKTFAAGSIFSLVTTSNEYTDFLVQHGFVDVST